LLYRQFVAKNGIYEKPPMADIEFICPHCDGSLVVDEAGAGMKVECPVCAGPLLLPTLEEWQAIIAEAAEAGETKEAAETTEAAGEEDDFLQPEPEQQLADEDAGPPEEAQEAQEAEDDAVAEDFRVRGLVLRPDAPKDVDLPGARQPAFSAAAAIAAREAAEREAVAKHAAEKEAAERKAAEFEAAERETAEKEAARKDASEREAASEEAAAKEAARKEAAEKEAVEKLADEKQAAEKAAAGAGKEQAGGLFKTLLPRKKVREDEGGETKGEAREARMLRDREEGAVAAPVKGAGTVLPSRHMGRDVDEKALRRAAAIEAPLEPTEVVGVDAIVFACPDCNQRLMAPLSRAGKKLVCEACGAELKIPARGVREVTMLSPGKLKAGRTMAAGKLPDPVPVKDSGLGGGHTHDAKFTPFDLPKDEKGRVIRTAAQKALSFRLLPIALVAVLFIVLVGTGVWIYMDRIAGDGMPEVGERKPAAVSPAPEIEGSMLEEPPEAASFWQGLSDDERQALANEALAGYLAAPTLEQKAEFVRGGERMLSAMREYYRAAGGYVPEMERYGPVEEYVARWETESGGMEVKKLHVRFADNFSGVYALVRGEEEYLVDWGHAVGYGQASVARLSVSQLREPALLRANVMEATSYLDGFRADNYQSFLLSDRDEVSTITAYALRGGEVERRLRKAIAEYESATDDADALLPVMVPVTLIVRFEQTSTHMGYVIDDVLAAGWVLPPQLELLPQEGAPGEESVEESLEENGAAEEVEDDEIEDDMEIIG